MEIVVLVVSAFGCLLVGAIVLNDPPLNDPPGFRERLRTYLTTNVAETRRDHPFRELELPEFRLAPGQLLSRVEHVVKMLGWRVAEVDPDRYYLRAVVATPLLKFKDDVVVQIAVGAYGSELHVRSSSRVGRGDMGANTRHILDLLAGLGNLP